MATPRFYYRLKHARPALTFKRPPCRICGNTITPRQSWRADAFGYYHNACYNLQRHWRAPSLQMRPEPLSLSRKAITLDELLRGI